MFLSSLSVVVVDDGLRNRLLLICVFYEGPWDYLSVFFWGLRRDGSIRWEVPDPATGCNDTGSQPARVLGGGA